MFRVLNMSHARQTDKTRPDVVGLKSIPATEHIKHARLGAFYVLGVSPPSRIPPRHAPCTGQIKRTPDGRVLFVQHVSNPSPAAEHVKHTQMGVFVRGTPYASDARPSSASASDSRLPSAPAPATSSLFCNTFS